MRNRKIRLYLLSVVFAVLALPAFSQYSTNSPYTRFGLGDIAWGGLGQNMAMGGTGIAINDPMKLNYINPAAYSARDTMSVLFDFGLNVFMNQFNTSSQKSLWVNSNFHHIALSVPVGKYFDMGTGLVPYSSVGYDVMQEFNDLGTGDPLDYYFQGKGGIMKYFLGISGELFHRVSFGVNMNYLLGDIERLRLMSFPKNRGFAETYSKEKIGIGHTCFSLGMQYKETFGNAFFFTLGGIYELKTDLKSRVSNEVNNLFSGSEYYLDSELISPEVSISYTESDGLITLPSKAGFGFSLGIPQKLTITGEYSEQDWSTVDNSALNVEGFDLAKYSSYNAGIEFIPDIKAFRGYHKLMSYRAGGYYTNSYVKVGEYQLSDYGITFGVGLPIGRSRSALNVSYTLGTRGTTANNLVKENYGILTFSVTLYDLWFIKRKFD